MVRATCDRTGFQYSMLTDTCNRRASQSSSDAAGLIACGGPETAARHRIYSSVYHCYLPFTMRRSTFLNLPEQVLFWAKPRKVCYIDRLPVEVLEPISVLACTDNGSTGCALSRVSQRMRAATRAGRFTSVALSSRTAQQLASFLACFVAERSRVAAGYSTPKVRHLFLASAKRTLKDDDPGAGEELKSYQQDISSLIDLVATDLYSLLVFHERGFYGDELYLPDIGLASYPSLVKLSVFGGGLRFVPTFPGWDDDDAADSTEDTPCLPRLTHLQLSRTSGYSSGIGRLKRWTREAPGLTHLFLSNIDYPDRFPVLHDLRDIVNLNGSDSLNDLQVLIVQPTAAPPMGGKCGTPGVSYRQFAQSLSELHESGVRRWALLPVVKRSTGRKEFERAARKEWFAWQHGRPGCWSVDKSYYRT
ncbi:hypothetical protein C8T65DRAFT_648030 [Cerioporus squamosus]|nr:hypothetical protein C8T65DRAFT_648030 [Cerioporus squamosus]